MPLTIVDELLMILLCGILHCMLILIPLLYFILIWWCIDIIVDIHCWSDDLLLLMMWWYWWFVRLFIFFIGLIDMYSCWWCDLIVVMWNSVYIIHCHCWFLLMKHSLPVIVIVEVYIYLWYCYLPVRYLIIIVIIPFDVLYIWFSIYFIVHY